MGKQLKKASVKTWRSLLFFYNKCITLAFALFCAGFGSAVKAAPLIPPDTSVTIKGKAYKMPGHTPLRKVKLYLSEVLYPLYGMSCGTRYYPVDTTTTDSEGAFVFENIPKIRSGVQEIAFSMYDSTNLPRVQEYVSDTVLNTKNLKDTTVTINLKPYICVGVIDEKKISAERATIAVQCGQSIVMKLPDTYRFETFSAVLLSINGEKITSVNIGNNRTLSLDTKSYAPGMYILSMTFDKSQMLQRVLIK